MRLQRSASGVAAVLIGIAIFIAGCGRPAGKAPLPSAPESGGGVSETGALVPIDSPAQTTGGDSELIITYAEWIIVSPCPPELLSQSRTGVFLMAGGKIRSPITTRESGVMARPLYTWRIPLGDIVRGKGNSPSAVAYELRYRARLHETRLGYFSEVLLSGQSGRVSLLAVEGPEALREVPGLIRSLRRRVFSLLP